MNIKDFFKLNISRALEYNHYIDLLDIIVILDLFILYKLGLIKLKYRR
jgi:hypothetical protein